MPPRVSDAPKSSTEIALSGQFLARRLQIIKNNLYPDAIRAMEAKVFLAAEAKTLKLIDGVKSIERVLADLADGRTGTISGAQARALTQVDEMDGAGSPRLSAVHARTLVQLDMSQ